MGQPLSLDTLRPPEGQLERLVSIEPGIAVGIVAVGEIGIRDRAGAAGALRHVLAGHLEVDTARMRALGAMDREELIDLAQDAVEWTCLEVRRRSDRVAVHGIARPNDVTSGLLHAANKLR